MYGSNIAFVVPSDAPRFEESENIFDTIKERNGYRLYVIIDFSWHLNNPIATTLNKYFESIAYDQFRFVRAKNTKSYIYTEDKGSLLNDPFEIGIKEDKQKIVIDILL
jgi:hypothetical protein